MPVDALVGKAEGLLAKVGLGALVISRPSNITYFTGFKGGLRLIVLGGSEPVLLVGGVDLTAAEEHFSGSKVVVRHVKLGERLDNVTISILGELKPSSVGFDELPVKSYLRLSEELSNVELREVSDEIWALRKVKDERELKAIRKACLIASKGMEAAYELLQPGITELELAGEIERALRKAGSEAHPFEVIVASGPNSALPHARPSGRELKEGDLVVVDLGATYGGYVSDMTRTFVVGQASRGQEELYRLVLKAQQEAMEAIRAGVEAQAVDGVARSIIDGAGYGPYFIHSLGHGLGLEVHEPPRIGPGASEQLLAGSTITVEPGIYIPGRYGIRIEDTVLVLEDGYEVFTKFPYGLKPQ